MLINISKPCFYHETVESNSSTSVLLMKSENRNTKNDCYRQGDKLQIPRRNRKPRLKWTKELHQHFVLAVNQLGGPHGKYEINRTFEYVWIPIKVSNFLKAYSSTNWTTIFAEATPRNILKLMGLQQITSNHIKSHLQVSSKLPK